MSDDIWPIENIPDADILYYRIHRKQIEQSGGRIARGHFKERGGAGATATPPSMSTDWSAYSSPAESRARAAQPEENLIVSLPVGRVREIDAVSVVHSPVQNEPEVEDNRSHTDVFGISRNPRARDHLLELAKVVLPLEER